MDEKKGLEELLSKKTVSKDNKPKNEDLKSRMERVINANKRLNDADFIDTSIDSPASKTQALKEKLEKAKLESEQLAMEELEEENEIEEIKDETANKTYTDGDDDLDAMAKAKKAEYLAKKNQKAKEKATLDSEEKHVDFDDDLDAMVRAKKAEYLAKKNQEALEKLEQEDKKLDDIINSSENVENKANEVISDNSITNEQEEINAESVQTIENAETSNETVSLDNVTETIINNEEKVAETPANVETSTETKEVKKPTHEKVVSDEENEIPNVQDIKEVPKRTIWKDILEYIIKTMNGMAFGLFATLIIGTIISTLGQYVLKNTGAGTILYALGHDLLMNLTGVGIGIGIAYSLGYKDIKLIALALTGAIASYLGFANGANTITESFSFKVGDPLTIYLVVVITEVLLRNVFRKKTPVDIILVPLFTCLLSASITILVSKYTLMITTWIGEFIGVATEYHPVLMGLVIAVVMGMALTAPISSAAISATIFTLAAYEGNEYVAIAAGAALIGCSTQMLGFAIQSRKDNNVGSIIAIGLGTSMLQFKNILRKPIIWLPTIIASAILGPISTALLKVKCAAGAFGGMGTSGLVGLIGEFIEMGNSLSTWLILIGFGIIAPTLLVFLIDIVFRKFGWIKEGDFKL